MLKISAIVLAATVALAALPADAQSRRIPHYNGGGGSESTATCGSELGYLPRVYPQDVAAVTEENHVWVNLVCEGGDLVRNEGNAAYLTKDMKANPVVNGVLRAAGFFPEDVYAIRKMGDGTIGLYVSTFTRSNSNGAIVYAY